MRYRTLFLAALASATLLAGARPAAAADARPAARRPNVLFVISDDLSARISPAGYQGVLTPVARPARDRERPRFAALIASIRSAVRRALRFSAGSIPRARASSTTGS
jgi:hypothetical protein